MKLSDKSIMTSMNFPTLPYNNVTYSFLLEIWFWCPTHPTFLYDVTLLDLFFLKASLSDDKGKGSKKKKVNVDDEANIFICNTCHHDETKAKAEEKWGETCFWVKKRRKIFSSDTTCWNSSTRAKIAYFCIRFDLTIGLAIKNYPKLTLDMLTSIHWIKCYVNVFFHVSWCVQWPHHWIELVKLPQNDPQMPNSVY